MRDIGMLAMLAGLGLSAAPALPERVSPQAPFQKSRWAKAAERGTGKCGCGKTISANKSKCYACATRTPEAA